jgi:murein DD-endopeptidase
VRKLVSILCIAWAMGAAGAPGARAAETRDSAAELEVRSPFAPQVVTVGDSRQLFYELHVANYGRSDLTLDDLKITDAGDGAVLGDYAAAALGPMIWRPDAAAANARRLPAGGVAVIYVQTPLAGSGPAPRALAWRLSLSNPDPSKPAKDLTPIGGEIDIDRGPPLVIGFPFKGGDWAAVNGPSNASLHRRSLQQVNGTGRIAQRYAIDWIKLDGQGRAYHGDKTVAGNWTDFGVEVLAVADGKVSASHDGIPNNVPLNGRAVPITLETVGGNYLMIDLGGGRYGFYAHLQPGTQRVHVGDLVHKGQVLALLGNTGNSDAPHLHFHVADGDSPLGSEGVAYVFDAYQTLGRAGVEQVLSPDGWKPAPGQAPIERHDSLPAEDEVVRVP